MFHPIPALLPYPTLLKLLPAFNLAPRLQIVKCTRPWCWNRRGVTSAMTYSRGRYGTALSLHQ